MDFGLVASHARPGRNLTGILSALVNPASASSTVLRRCAQAAADPLKIALVEGNPAGRTRGSRNKLSEEVICALLRDFRRHGQKAVARVRQTQPAAYLKILALLVPREHKVEHSNPIKDLTDEQLEAMIEYIKTSLEAQAGAPAKMIEGTIEPISVEIQRGPLLDSPKPKNRVMLEADTAVGPRERLPRKVRPPPGS
jgi:hypothetical protein